MPAFEERRKSPRVAVGGQYVFRADQRVRVRLLDISAAGALLQTDERLPVGGVGKLRLSLGGHAVRDDRRSQARGASRGSRVAGWRACSSWRCSRASRTRSRISCGGQGRDDGPTVDGATAPARRGTTATRSRGASAHSVGCEDYR